MKTLISPSFGGPAGYEVIDEPDLCISKPSTILIEVKAASVNGHDVIMASGRTKALQKLELPYRLGIDFAGVVRSKGAEVTSVTEGDAVYGSVFHVGTIATQILVDMDQPLALSRIPKSLDFVAAASLPAVGITAWQVLQKADTVFKDSGGLQGKRIFIPAALSGVGSVALQLAKNVWNCETVTAVSTGKIAKIPSYLGSGVVDLIVDYSQQKLSNVIGERSLDFVFDTTGLSSEYLPLVKQGGLCLSIARIPPGSALKEDGQSRMACIGQTVLDGIDATFRTWARTRYSVTYVYHKTDPVTSDLEALSTQVDRGALKPVVGETAGIDDLDAIKTASTRILEGKGSVGKFVVTF